MFALSLSTSPYPQRQENYEPTWLNRVAERCRTALRARFVLGRHKLYRVARRVEAERRTWLAALDTAARNEALLELRRRLRRQGFADEVLVARLLALVADAAQRTLGLQPHPPQLIGAFVLLHGQVLEMDTGEGKSLTAALAAACAALAGCRVHVITVNDYLAERDGKTFAGFYATLGLSVAAVSEDQSPEAKRAPYAADVVYCANKVVVFDYLRDRLALGEELRPLGLTVDALLERRQQPLLLRGLQFAIVDEADSVFVDEARTPLVIATENDDPARAEHFRQTLSLAGQLQAGDDFQLPSGSRTPQLTDAGSERLAVLAAGMSGLLSGPRLREEAVTQALAALHAFRRDIDYIVHESKVMIVDENTGRVMPDRSWEQGLQQLIELKEGLPPTPLRENMARLSYQLFFRRYLHLAGMTGTAREVAAELGEVYGLGVVRVAPFRPSRRKRLPTRLFATAEARWVAVVEAVRQCRDRGQPVLVGTRSVLASEHLSQLLHAGGIGHRVLNAKQNAEEAAIVAKAGECGCVTIATNMAGRGTDIKLGEDVLERGGLHVILTEGHDNTRVDRQLAGRCARQGDPGSWQALLSLEDDVMRVIPPKIRYLLRRGMGSALPSVFGGLASFAYHLAQAWISRRHRGERRRLLRADYSARQAMSYSGVAE